MTKEEQCHRLDKSVTLFYTCFLRHFTSFPSLKCIYSSQRSRQKFFKILLVTSLTLSVRYANNLIKYTHATLVTRIVESAAARWSLSAVEFRNRETCFGHISTRKKCKRCILLLTTAIYIISYAFAA